MRGWALGLAVACSRGDGEGTGCLRPLDAWCSPLDSEQCVAPTVEELLAEDVYYGWHTECDDPEHGLLEVVGHSNGYDSEEWYFDADGRLVAYLFRTDYGLCTANASTQPSTSSTPSTLVYGFSPECRG